MIPWFAMPCDLADAPHLARFAAAASITVDAAYRAFGKLWARMAQHDDERGQLREIPDATLEEWAGWRGRAGRFALAFRESYELPDGTMRFWEETNGPQIRKLKRDALRKRNARRRGSSPDDPDQGALPLNGPPPPPPPLSGGLSTDAGADSPRTRARTVARNIDRDSTTASAIAAAVVPGGGSVPLNGRASRVREALPEAYRAAYDGIRGSLRVGDSLDAECELLAEGSHGPGGRPVPWPVIGHALHDCAGTAGAYSHRKLGAFVVDLLRRADATDVLEAEIGRKFTPGERTAVDALRAFAAAGAA